MVVMFRSILPDTLMLRSWWLCVDPYFWTLLCCAHGGYI